jgi:hypothetical protein
MDACIATVVVFLPEDHEPADWAEASLINRPFLSFKSLWPPIPPMRKRPALAAIIFRNSRRLTVISVSNTFPIKEISNPIILCTENFISTILETQRKSEKEDE